MGSLGNPKPWVPYMINTKDCSQGFCSLYCPQWCYVIFPPPPPIEFPEDHKDSAFSPLVIAVICILASAFLLVTYYAIISKYCKKRDSSNGREIQNPIEESQENQDSLLDVQSLQGSNNGVDEALIKSITMFKFKKQEGLTEATDCSVCLSEFEENESLRLLPKCNHAFHKMCIDTWLKSHSNCPLCRSNIVFVSPLPSQLSPVVEAPTPEESPSQSSDHVIDNVTAEEEDIETGVQEIDFRYTIHEQAPSRHARNSDDSDVYNTISMVKNNDSDMRRSKSMDHVSHYKLSVADVLRIDQEEEDQRVDQCPYWDGAETSKRAVVAMCKSSCGNGVLHCVAGGAIVKRSLSSGRFLLSNVGGKGRNVSLPV